MESVRRWGDLCESELSRFISDRGRLIKAYLSWITEIGTRMG